MKIYCINLERSPDRRAYCENLFAEMGADVLFIKGIDGQHLTPPNNIKGNFDSHRLIWNKIAHTNSPEPVMILEDDCIMDTGVLILAEYLKRAYHISYHVAMFGYWNPSGAPDTSIMIDTKFKVIYGGDYRSTVGYVVNGAKTARLLLKTLPNKDFIDIELYRAIREDKIKAIFTAPGPVIHQGGFHSTIG